MNYNRVQLAGRLTRDPESKPMPNGGTITKVSIAVNRTYKAENGEKREEVTFIDCTAFGKQADNLAKYLKKGSGVFIDGRLKLESWEDKATKQQRSRLSVVVENFQFIDGKPAGTTAATTPAPTAASAPSAAPSAPAEDDVPF